MIIKQTDMKAPVRRRSRPLIKMTGNIPDKSKYFEKLDFWSHLNDEEKQKFFCNTRAVNYKKGALVHSANDKCEGMIMIKNGHLRTYMLSETGKEVTLYRLFTDDICILSASCVLDSIAFDVFINAEEDTEVLITDASFFHNMAEENIRVQNFGYQLAVERFSDVMWAMQQILFMGIDKRLAIFLWDESLKAGSSRIYMTQERIASYIGSAREVVTRILKYFSDEGIIESFRGGIEIKDKEKLKKLAL